MSRFIIDAAGDGDMADILTLNDLAVPHVNRIGADELAAIVAQSAYFRIARVDDRVGGFMLALAQGAGYRSPNYRWFDRRYSDFLYVDRVVVDGRWRGMGIGTALYRDIERSAAAGIVLIACEVNVHPPNPQSATFHHRLGFREIGRQRTEGGTKEVALLVKEIA